MPLLVRTPEQILRAERKDLYIIRSLEKQEREAPGLTMIQKWIGKNVPGTGMELLGPSEYSSILVGGIGRDVRVDFNPETLKKFCERWEDANGKSVDKRFQCLVYPFYKWLQERARFVPRRDKPKRIARTVWWYTPHGFVYHQLPQRESKRLPFHPARAQDVWFHVPDLWPDLAACDPGTLTYGSIVRPGDGDSWRVAYTKPFTFGDEAFRTPTPKEIRDWFGLPSNVAVREEEF